MNVCKWLGIWYISKCLAYLTYLWNIGHAGKWYLTEPAWCKEKNFSEYCNTYKILTSYMTKKLTLYFQWGINERRKAIALHRTRRAWMSIRIYWCFLQNGDFWLGRDRAVKTTHRTLAQIVCEVWKNTAKRPCLVTWLINDYDKGLRLGD